MRPLHGSDLFHVREERVYGRPAHTLKVAVVGGRPDAEELASWAREVLPCRAPFTWRLADHPALLGRPHWVDTTPHAEQIVRHTLDAPDGLDAFLGRLAGERLATDRPPWRLWVVDGLDDEQVALVLQMHHALADGAASVRIWEELFADQPDPPVAETTLAPVRTADSLRRHGRLLRDLPRLLTRLRANADAAKVQPSAPDRNAGYFEAPPTAFNERLTDDRICAFVTLPLATIAAARRSLDGTVNDMYVALCAGALRAYLQEHGHLPDDSLTATSPVGLERPGPYGNAMTTWFVRLATDEADPRTRFESVQASLGAARRLQDLDPTLLYDLQDHARFYGFTWRVLDIAERRKGRPTFNVIISNVRGPAPLEWRGHPVVALRSLGPLAGTMGINFTAWSYGDDFTVGLHACRDQVPDLARLAELLADELAVLAALG